MKKSYVRSKKRLRLSIKVKKILMNILQWLLLILIAVVVGYSFIVMCFQTINVVGPSMYPTLKDNQTVIVNKLDYKVNKIKRFDIIAFSKMNENEYYDIKRVIALPGEKIKISSGNVYINGEKLTGLPFNDKILLSGAVSEEITLKDNESFVLGDNVNNSEDSRYNNIGLITKSEVIGKVTKVIKPKSDKGKVK